MTQQLTCNPQAFQRAVLTYDNAAQLQQLIAQALAQDVTRALATSALSGPQPIARALEIGCGTGFFTQALTRRVPVHTLFLNDLTDAMLAHARQVVDRRVIVTPLLGDAEDMIWPSPLDLVASSSVVQWFKNPLNVTDRAYSALRVGGLLAVSTFLPATLTELKQLLHIGLNYPSVSDWCAALANGFEVCALHTTRHTLTFESPRAVLRHLQRTGVTGQSPGFRWTRNKLEDFETQYRKRYATVDGAVRLTYSALRITARKVN